MTKFRSGVTYDEQGFIVSHKIEKKLTSIDDGVADILKLLGVGVNQTLQSIQAKPLDVILHRQQVANFGRLLADAIVNAEKTTQTRSRLSSRNTSQTLIGQAHNQIAEEERKQRTTRKNRRYMRRVTDASATDSLIQAQDGAASDSKQQENKNKNRDARGRFIAGEVSTIKKVSDVIDKLSRPNVGGFQSGGIDPTIDALNEVSILLSPVKTAASFVFKPLTGLAKLKKRAEPLPKEEVDHNRKQLRVLQFISDGIARLKPNNSGVGFLGNLLKKGRGLPVIGSLLALMSLSNWDEKSVEDKGATVGTIGGGVLGGALGSFLGPVGTVVGAGIGAWIGNELGEEVAPYFEKWVSQLELANLPKQIIDSWKGFISDLWADFKKSIPQPIKDTVQNTTSFLGSVGSWIADKATSGYNAVFGGSTSPDGLINNSTGQSLGKYKSLADAVAQYESKGSYTIANTGGYEKKRVKGDFKTVDVPNLTNMSIGEILERNQLPVGHKDRLNAVGRYQIIASNLKSWIKDGSLQSTDKFTPELQDKLFMKLLPKAAKDYADGKNVSLSTAQNSIAQVWAAVPRSDTGRSAHEGVGLNKANPKAGGLVKGVLNDIRMGRVTGQESSSQKIPLMLQQPTDLSKLDKTPAGSKALADFANKASIPNQTSFVPTIKTPMASPGANKTPTVIPYKLPSIELAKQNLNQPKPQQLVATQSSPEVVYQDVSDRSLAHAITGGIGRNTTWSSV